MRVHSVIICSNGVRHTCIGQLQGSQKENQLHCKQYTVHTGVYNIITIQCTNAMTFKAVYAVKLICKCLKQTHNAGRPACHLLQDYQNYVYFLLIHIYVSCRAFITRIQETQGNTFPNICVIACHSFRFQAMSTTFKLFSIFGHF